MSQMTIKVMCICTLLDDKDNEGDEVFRERWIVRNQRRRLVIEWQGLRKPSEVEKIAIYRKVRVKYCVSLLCLLGWILLFAVLSLVCFLSLLTLFQIVWIFVVGALFLSCVGVTIHWIIEFVRWIPIFSKWKCGDYYVIDSYVQQILSDFT